MCIIPFYNLFPCIYHLRVKIAPALGFYFLSFVSISWFNCLSVGSSRRARRTARTAPLWSEQACPRAREMQWRKSLRAPSFCLTSATPCKRAMSSSSKWSLVSKSVSRCDPERPYCCSLARTLSAWPRYTTTTPRASCLRDLTPSSAAQATLGRRGRGSCPGGCGCGTSGPLPCRRVDSHGRRGGLHGQFGSVGRQQAFSSRHPAALRIGD
jgi:hypothetical protein